LSYFVGWIVTIAWQAGAAGVAFLTSNVILALANAIHPEYEMKNWHVTLAFFAVIAVAVFVTTVLGRLLPTIESLAFVIFVMGFFVLLIVLKYLAPKTDNAGVWENFFNGGNWNNNVEATFVGAIPIMFGFNGFDAGVHLGKSGESIRY
jgi:choline transport protein